MKHDPEKHHRRSIRLKGYDYSQDRAYFVTICTHSRACLFGEVVDGEMRMNEFGEIVAWTWHDLPNHVPDVELDAFIVMPNHVHGIVVIPAAPDDTVVVAGARSIGAGSEPVPTKRYALPEIMRQFKTFSARRINQRRGTAGAPVWQRNYYEHIIRNEESLNRIRQYIANNPLQWKFDRENPNVGARHTVPLPMNEPWRI